MLGYFSTNIQYLILPNHYVMLWFKFHNFPYIRYLSAATACLCKNCEHLKLLDYKKVNAEVFTGGDAAVVRSCEHFFPPESDSCQLKCTNASTVGVALV